MNIADPVIRQIKDNRAALDNFEKNFLQSEEGKTRKLIVDYPTVYIHNWKNSRNFEVYVGESNDVLKRTKQHYDAADAGTGWQKNLWNRTATLYIIGHEHFNKSLTLDIENRLIHYMMSVGRVKQVHNLRGNPQEKYYPVEKLDPIFNKIWRKLHHENEILFPSASQIRDSAIYKASPLHKLTKRQNQAKELIIERVETALKTGITKQFIFIDGEAGTGKTVLNSSTFYELYCRAEERGEMFNCCMIVNHNEQRKVYEQIAGKLGMTENHKKVVYKPTTFINSHTEKNPVDVAFVDEAHLLWTQGKQSYRGKNQLKDIIDRARITVIMFDEYQILTTEQYWEAKTLEEYRNLAKTDGNHIILDEQLRMQADPETMDWIDSFTKQGILKGLPRNDLEYSLRVFDSPEEMEKEIRKKAANKETALSRVIATYDWEYSSIHRPKEHLLKYWEVLIGNWHRPWNYELEKELTGEEKKNNKTLSWAEQPQTIKEIGSTFTIQGFDLNYSEVILGPSVKYRNGKVIFDPSESHNDKAVQNRTLSDGSKKKFGEILIQHEVRVLMTRGVNGMYIYACDDELREALKKAR